MQITHSGEWRRLARVKILNEMGGKCVQCGVADMRCLHIDHVNGGGTKHKKIARTETQRYKAVRANPSDFQILCANCNTIKRWVSGQSKGPDKYLSNPKQVKIVSSVLL